MWSINSLATEALQHIFICIQPKKEMAEFAFLRELSHYCIYLFILAVELVFLSLICFSHNVSKD